MPPSASLTPAQRSAAVHENIYALFRAMAALPGGELFESEQFCCHAAPPAYGMFRGAWRARVAEDQVDAAVAGVKAWFRARGGQDFFWWTDATSQPVDLNQRLVQRGFDGDLVGETGMHADLAALAPYSAPPPGLEVRLAQNPAELAQWGRVFCAAFNEPPSAGQGWAEATLAFAPHPPPWQPYIAWLDGVALGASLLFCGAGVAGLYAVSTLPAARRRGIGAAVTLQPLLAARAQGYRYAVLFASRMGHPIYRRLGFVDAANPIGIYQGNANAK
jgi:GNAT superfamily N-acetyltransferase